MRAGDRRWTRPARRGPFSGLRILLARPEGRGHGLGGRLVDTCLAFARQAGHALRLWTNHPLVAASVSYRQRGFVHISGQVYERDLANPSS
ncbi:MAG: hypothetical protein M3Z50_12615 [Actinomycetota bacterium]|nr:hypothetical protein [Actinomycetota bacterium]